jgi:nucleotide-binding universal stress UspA family protein
MFVIPHTPIWARVEASELLANNVTQKMKEAEQLLKTQYEDRCDKDIQTRKIVREGREYQEIIAFAKDEKVDLIIVGTHGQTGLGHVLLGSVAEKVVRNSKVPVLVVPS